MGSKQVTRTPPHVSLRLLRVSHGMTLEDVAEAVSAVLGLKKPMNRGTIAAIETGIRGASHQMLDALAAAYGLPPGAITTDYDPRASRIHKEAS